MAYPNNKKIEIGSLTLPPNAAHTCTTTATTMTTKKMTANLVCAREREPNKQNIMCAHVFLHTTQRKSWKSEKKQQQRQKKSMAMAHMCCCVHACIHKKINIYTNIRSYMKAQNIRRSRCTCMHTCKKSKSNEKRQTCNFSEINSEIWNAYTYFSFFLSFFVFSSSLSSLFNIFFRILLLLLLLTSLVSVAPLPALTFSFFK